MAGRYTLTQSAYAVLGVGKSASDDDIRKAYRKKARETHPDVGGSATRFAEVQQAWELIGTSEARANYDNEQRYAAAAAGSTTQTGYATSSGPHTTTIDFETFIRAAAAAQQQRPGDTRPGYWAEFGPGTAWKFNSSVNNTQAPTVVPVSWIAMATPALAFFFPIGGVVAGLIGLYQTRQRRRVGRMFASWGLVVSLVTTVIWALPSLLRIIG